MRCETCGDVGIVTLNFQEGDEYGLCLCRSGEEMRRQYGPVQLWQCWCACHGIDPAKVKPIEDVLTAAELAERGFKELTASDSISAVISVAKRKHL